MNLGELFRQVRHLFPSEAFREIRIKGTGFGLLLAPKGDIEVGFWCGVMPAKPGRPGGVGRVGCSLPTVERLIESF